MRKNKRSKRIIGAEIVLTLIAIIAVLGVAMLANQIAKRQSENLGLSAELARTKAYDRVEEGDKDVEGTENVKFDAFFLRDLEGNGYATGVRGTCKEIGKEDTLYMEINVQTAGYLKDAKITIDGKNFYLQTTLPKDEQLQNSYIGNNIKEIKFNHLTNGTQKLITGIVRSGDYTYTSSRTTAIGNNINNYSKEDNKIILTGTYVDENGTETPITKEVPFTIDWYGTTRASIYSTTQNRYIDSCINEEEGTLNLDFTVSTEETDKKLILKTNHVEGEIPELNGYAPISVIYTGTNAIFNYDEATRTFTIDKTSTIGEDGRVTTSLSTTNSYGIKVTYPLEAYQTLETEQVTIKMPVKTYYEGYNNPNAEFKNPYKSNTAQATITASYQKYVQQIQNTELEIKVGRRVYDPVSSASRYIISKQKPLKIYNGQSEEEKDDTYTVMWRAYIGTKEELQGLTLKETKEGQEQVTDQFIKTDATTESTDDVVANVGIYFSGADTILGDEGEIRVYDDETGNLLVTFTKDNWNKYTTSNPYKYEIPVKHIRVETSKVIKNEASLYVYNIKEIDDEAITTKYERDQFDELKYIKSTLTGNIGTTYTSTVTHQAIYEAPMSIATIGISKNTISTQFTEKNVKLTIATQVSESNNLVSWKDGEFLVKFPTEIIDVQVNNISINNSSVKVENYEVIEQEGQIFIKIITNNITPQNYTITIDADLSPDPRISTTTRSIELYATNENGSDYYYKSSDIHDVNNNLNTTEQVNYRTTSISMVSPSSLLTNQTATNYDDKGSMIISPKIADIKPTYAVIDQEQQEEATAKIGIQLKNNYASTISEIEILGKIPFEGNTYVISGKDLGSTFTTKLVNTGIEIPEELKEIATVYYSENENPDRDLTNTENNWKTADQAENWDNIKTFLIDLGDYVMPTGKEFVFNYTVTIPNGLEFNKVSYSHHGVYFCLDTENGKYRTQTEPNRLGFRIAEKYDLEIEKYQTGKDKLVPGATYSITEIIQKEDGIEEKGEAKTGLTNENGKIKITNLYAKKEYEIKEIKTPDDYEINPNVIRFIGNVDEYGDLTINKLTGETREDIIVTKEEGENYKVTVKVEDEAKARLKITKKEQDTENTIQNIRYKITGYNLPETGKTMTTNRNGEISIKGLKIGQEYTLTEVKAEGYYIAEPITFKIINNEGSYVVEIISGTVKENNITEENSIPTINMTLENEKIPTYDLEIIKIKKTTNVNVSNTETTEGTEEQTTYLSGAKFKLYKETKEIGEYITGEDGKVIINNLYQYVEGKDENATYTLKEVLAPEGYAKVKDITFKVQEQEGLVFINIDERESKYTTDGNIVKLTIEDSPSFKLIKKDGETGELLSNIKFAIYNVDEGEKPAQNSKGEILGTKETINGKEYYTVSTDNKGEITADLTEGLYKAVEVQAPAQYDISKNTYYFGIGSSREGIKDLQAEWGKAVGGSKGDYINCITETADGGYIVGGYFYSSRIDLGNGVVLNNNNSPYQDGMIIKYSKNKEVEWAKSVSGRYYKEINYIIETGEGEYVVVGNFNSKSIDLGNGVVLNNNGASDGMIIKYGSDGEVKWGKVVGGSERDYINSIIEMTDGGYVVVGHFISKSIDLGSGVVLNSKGSTDGMIIKYGRNGEVEWGKAVGGNSVDDITCITETRDGGYIIRGSFRSESIDLENEVVLNNSGYQSGMIIKYSENGKVEWGKVLIETGNDYITCITETRDGGYIVGGYFYNSIDLGSGVVLNSKGSTDGMIIKYGRNGEVEWGKAVGGSNDDRITCIKETQDGGYIVGGDFQSSSIDLGNGEVLNNNGAQDGMIIKYDSDGNVEWGKAVGGSYDDKITCVTETKDEGYVIGGYSGSSIDLGNGEVLNNKGNSDGMIIKYNVIEKPEVNIKQGKVIGGNNNDRINCIIETREGGYLAGGYFQSSSIDLGNGEVLNNNGAQDGMIIKYGRNGEVEWGKAVGGSSSDYINCIVETREGGYLVGGYFSSSSIELENRVVLNNINSNNGRYSDGMIIKYSVDGEVEWGKAVGGSYSDYINCIIETREGGYLVGGYFASSSIDLGNGVVLSNSGDYDGMLIKYGSNGEAEWGKAIGGSDEDRINCIIETREGGYLVGGYFYSSSIDLGNGEVLSNKGYTDGMLIKYGVDGEVEWGKAVGGSDYDYINCIIETREGGYLVGGYFNSRSIDLGNGVVLNNYTTSGGYNNDGMIIKYSESGEVEWGKAVGGSNDDRITCIKETQDGGYIVGGDFQSSSIDLGNGVVLNNHNTNNSSDGMLIKIAEEMGVPEVEELVVENTRKEFKITTDVKEIDGIKGGNISGEDKSAYEKVKYGDNSTKEIDIIPDTDYEIIKITINGEEYQFTRNADGTYRMPQFENMTENKHIVVTFAMKDNKITINKVDRRTRIPLAGVKFRLDQIEERTEPENVIGELTNNGQTYIEIDETNEITGAIGELTANGQDYNIEVDSENEIIDVIGELTNNGTYYFIYQDGKYVPTNSKTYQTANGGTTGKHNTTANSYMEIDLSNKEGKYVVCINAEVSSESADRGYATITETTTAPVYNSTTGQFIYISGTQTAKEYTSIVLEGGKTYYLHLGYRKDGSVDTGKDQIIFNSIKVYGATSTTYNFVDINGKYESNNQGQDNTVANSYISIDLSNKEGKYFVKVNAEVSSQSSNDYGYATITENTIRPVYSNSTGRLIYISGTQTAKDYISTVLEGGKTYYLHLGYYKNASTSTGDDKFTVNSVGVYGSTSPTYYFEGIDGKYESNNQGKDNTVANSYIPIDLRSYSGKYNITVKAEISSQSGNDIGYATITETTDRVAYSSTTGRFIYISGEQEEKDYTTVLEGGKQYYLHLGYYKNASTSTGEDKFTVNSIEVTLNDSELYHTEVETNSQGQAITQLPFGKYSITEIEAPEGYNILEEPIIIEFRADENHEFTIENEAKAKVIINHYKAIKNADGTYTLTEEKLAESEKQEGKENDEYTSIPHLDLGKYELIKDENGEYIIPENAVGKLAIEETVVNYYYVEKEIPLTVHHYIEGTEEKVPLKDGTKAEDITEQGKEGESYTTTPISEENLSEKYELVEIPENANGTYEGEEIIVTYYYKKAKRDLTINKYSEDGTTPLEGVKFTITPKTEDIKMPTPTETTIYTTNAQGKIKVELEVGRYEVTEVETPNEYQIPEEATTEIEITKETETAEIEITNIKKRGKVITHHYIEGTETKVPKEDGTEVQDEEQEGVVGEPFATKKSEEVPEYYEYVSSSEKTYGEYTEETQEVIYYYKIKEYNYTVEYYYDNIKDEEATETTKATYKSIIEEYTDKIKEGYRLEKEENLPLTVEQDETQNIIKIYYVKRNDLKYTVNYLEKGTNKVLHEPKEETNQEFETEITTSNEIITIEGYKYDSSDKESITISTNEDENVINIYYTKKDDLSYTVNYLEKGTNEELHISKTEYNQEYQKEIQTSNEIIEISGYKYDSSDKESIKISTNEDENVINIYYIKRNDLKYTVNYLEEDTNEVLHEQKVVENQEYNQEIKTKDEIIDIEGYEYSSSDKESITIQEDETQNVITVYYIKRSDLKYTVNYLEKDTNKELHDSKVTEDQVYGGEVLANTEIIEIEGYKFDSYDKESITIQVDETENVINIYYTIKTDIKYKVEYYYDGTKDEEETEEYEATYKEIIDSYEDKIRENYVLVEVKGTPLMIEDDESKNVIEVYYVKKAQATVQYIDKTTGEILEEITEEGYVGKEFQTETKDFDDYILVEEPEEKTVQMEEEEIVLKYYYIHISSGVIEKHIDIETGEILYNTTYEGNEGDEYKTEPKEFEHYEFVEEKYPENAEGTMAKELITVKYYYKKIEPITITVKYIDKETGEEIEEQVEITDYEGTEYKTEQKEIEGYEFVEVVGETEGTITEEKEIIYYYQKVKQPEIPGEGGDDPVIDEEQQPPQIKDPTATDKEIPSAGLTKEQIAIIVVTVMSVITGILVVIAIKGTIIIRKYKN